MADRDVAEMRTTLRGHTQVLNALRETQIEQGQTLADHGQTLAAHGRTLQTIAEAVGGLVAGQAAMAEQMQQHGRILARLDPGDQQP